MHVAPESPRHWWQEPLAFVLAGGMVMGLSLGARHAFGIFMLPVTLEHGWSRETFSFAIALQNLIWGIAQPLVGMVADRHGSRRVVIAGLVCYGGGLAGMAVGATPLAFTLSAGVAVGVALACTSFGVVYGALSRMVAPERRGWALGLAGAAGGLGQFFLVPVSQALIDAFTWRGSLLALAIACVAVLPLALPLADAPSRAGGQQQSLRSALAEAFSHQGFRLLVLGFFACGFHLAFIANHLPSYLRDKNMAPSAAVIGLAVIALANVAGTYLCGLLGNRFRRKYVLFWIYVIRSLAIAAFYLLPLNQMTLYAFCAVMGFIWLGTVPLTNGVLSQIFGVRYLTTLFGFVFFGHQLGSFLGVWLGGVVFDATRSYDLVWQLSIAIGLISAALHYPIRDAEIRRPALSGAVA
ncbi:MAG TPA: MFS transporter [Rhodocyclaceae bacterium]|nr:MFS transporter [Rhodocyclaceae bacterium]HNH13261.1 MFS transporter [Rhodocyclaceae bacterium]